MSNRYVNQKAAFEIIDRLPNEMIAHVFDNMSEVDWIDASNVILTDMFGLTIVNYTVDTLALRKNTLSTYQTLFFNLRDLQKTNSHHVLNFWKFIVAHPSYFPFDFTSISRFLKKGIRHVTKNRMALDFVVLDTTSPLDIGLVTSDVRTEHKLDIPTVRTLLANKSIYRIPGSEVFYRTHLANSLHRHRHTICECMLIHHDNTITLSGSISSFDTYPTLDTIFTTMRSYMPINSRYSHINIFANCAYLQIVFFAI